MSNLNILLGLREQRGLLLSSFVGGDLLDLDSSGHP